MKMKMKTMSDLISRQDIKYHTQLEAMGNGQYEEVEVAYKNDIESLPSAETQPITCDGCKHVGTYDTDFPCSSCIRREKDYYEPEDWFNQQSRCD